MEKSPSLQSVGLSPKLSIKSYTKTAFIGVQGLPFCSGNWNPDANVLNLFASFHSHSIENSVEEIQTLPGKAPLKDTEGNFS